MTFISTKLENLWFKKDEVKYITVEERMISPKWVVCMGIGNSDFAVFGSNDKEEAFDVVKQIKRFVGEKGLETMELN